MQKIIWTLGESDLPLLVKSTMHLPIIKVKSTFKISHTHATSATFEMVHNLFVKLKKIEIFTEVHMVSLHLS
jgi:hypothetical protein